jgi:hypothetical protein
MPSHTEITGNETADKLAKKVITSVDAINCHVYAISNFKLIIKQKILKYGKMNGKYLASN